MTNYTSHYVCYYVQAEIKYLIASYKQLNCRNTLKKEKR